MSRIRFLSPQIYDTGGPGKGPRFAAGSVLDAADVGRVLGQDVSVAYADGFLERWVRRGVAQYLDDQPMAEGGADAAGPAIDAVGLSDATLLVDRDSTEADAPAIPEDWRGLSWPEMRALAAKVSDAPVRTKDEAEAAIVAALERRGG